jgi:small subunit ribosomal protein S6
LAGPVYECMFILDSNKYARDPNGVSGSVNDLIEKLDGEIHASRLWAEQKLAYPINNHRKGTYWLTYFTLDGSKSIAFDRACQLNDNILRHLVLKVDPRLADTLIAHATGANVADEGDTSEEGSQEKSADSKEPVAVGEGASDE